MLEKWRKDEGVIEQKGKAKSLDGEEPIESRKKVMVYVCRTFHFYIAALSRCWGEARIISTVAVRLLYTCFSKFQVFSIADLLNPRRLVNSLSCWKIQWRDEIHVLRHTLFHFCYIRVQFIFVSYYGFCKAHRWKKISRGIKCEKRKNKTKKDRVKSKERQTPEKKESVVNVWPQWPWWLQWVRIDAFSQLSIPLVP